MKLKYKIFSIFLSFSFCFITIFSSSTIVYAKTYYSWNEFIKDTYTYITYIASQIGAVCSSDFAQWIQNKDSWDNYWNEDNITFDNDNGNVIFSDDLVNYIKQALKEYAEETNGYIILPSVHFSTISPSSFGSSYQYQTVKALVNEYGLVGLCTYGSGSSIIYIKDFSDYLNNNAGFYIRSDRTNYYYVNCEDYLTWSRIQNANYAIKMFSSCEKVIHSWDEAESSADSTDGLDYYSFPNNSKYNDILINGQGALYENGDTNFVSKDGRRILVFKNQTALESYSVGHRTVYFGSKFYEDSGSVSGSWDDFQDWLDGKYDDLLDKLKDLIPEGSNISEDEFEKLIDKLLDQLDEIGDKVEEGNKETNNLLQQILNSLNKLDATVASAFSGIGFDTSGIEAYLARILADLDYIVYEMEDKTEEEISNDVDDMSTTVMDTFSDLGEVAKTKFPLSIPWDIYNLLTMLGGGSPTTASDVLPVSYDTSSSGFVSVSTYSLNETIPLSGEHGGGGNDHGTGNEDGGGGHSRGGYYLSADGDPVFVLPLVFSESMGLGGTINIDMAQFRVLSDISRTLFTLIFAINLVHLTFKAVGLGKDVLE